MKRTIITSILIIGLLVIWHIRTVKKHMPDLSGYFNNITTVCIPHTYAVKAHDNAALNAGAQCAYKRFVSLENITQPQQCYIKFSDSPCKQHPHLPYGHYQSTKTHNSQADMHLDGILPVPYNIYFNGNEEMQQQMNAADEKAFCVESIQEAVDILQRK